MSEYEVRGPMQNIHVSESGISLAKDFMVTIPQEMRAQITHDARSNGFLDYLKGTLGVSENEEDAEAPHQNSPGMG